MNINTLSFEELRDHLFSDPAFRKEYSESENIAFMVGRQVMKARITRGLSQEELAKKIRTKQPSIARLENGNSWPSLRFLKRIATALDTKLIPPKFEILEDTPSADLSFYGGWSLQSEISPLSPEVVSSSSFSGGNILEAVAILSNNN